MMAIRMFQARVLCDSDLLSHLWRTHKTFNERLPTIISTLFQMRRGDRGDLYKRIADFVLARNSKDAPYLMNSVSIPNWAPHTARKLKINVPCAGGGQQEILGESWANEAAALSANNTLLYDKAKVLGDIPDSMRQIVVREAVSAVHSYLELIELWETQHEEWLRRKQEWENDPEHQQYLKIRPRFVEFEASACGMVSKRRSRWHLYLQWLRENPSLATWRGGQPIVHPISPQGERKLQSTGAKRRMAVEFEEFLNANPELKALDRLHGAYEREFVRSWVKKRNADGFIHRPTFTLPDPLKHPRWLLFNAPQTSPQGYRNLALPESAGEIGSLELRLLTGKRPSGAHQDQWIQVRFKADPRLACLSRKPVRKPIRRGSRKGEEADQDAFEFFDEHLDFRLPAQIKGVRLILRNPRFDQSGKIRSASVYLYFAVELKNCPLTENAVALKWEDSGPATGGQRPRRKPKIPDGLVTCAVDLGIRNIGFATLGQYHSGQLRVLRSRNIWLRQIEEQGDHVGRVSAGPGLPQLASHKREIRRLRRLRGKPVKGEESHIELQAHITNMGKDRFQKAARSILDFALNSERTKDLPRADVLLVERLGGLVPDAEREHGINRALMSWNRGQLVARLKEMAEVYGFRRRVYEVPPYGTSQVCSHCGALGRRYAIRKDQKTGRVEIQFGPVEKLFACPKCGFLANADHNASVNLHRRFVLGEQAIANFVDWQRQPEHAKQDLIRSIETDLRDRLRRVHGLSSEEEDLPF